MDSPTGTCRHGDACYRTNPDHVASFHGGKAPPQRAGDGVTTRSQARAQATRKLPTDATRERATSGGQPIVLSDKDRAALDRLAGTSKRQFSRAERDAVFNLSKGKCFHCGREMTRGNSAKGEKGGWEVEHLKSVSECGGAADNRPGNLAVSCVACNRGDKATNTAGHFDTPLSQFDKEHGFQSHCQALCGGTGQRCDRRFAPDGRRKYCWQHSKTGSGGGEGNGGKGGGGSKAGSGGVGGHGGKAGNGNGGSGRPKSAGGGGGGGGGGHHYRKDGGLDMRYASSRAATAGATGSGGLNYRKDGGLDMRFASSRATSSDGGTLTGISGGIGGFGGGGLTLGMPFGGGGGGGGPRCADGSLDMRYSANKGLSKYD